MYGQSPHGDNLNLRCQVCHSAEGWHLDRELYSYNHDESTFPLTGQHASIECKMCHSSLVFSDAENTCTSCHLDMHQTSVGTDCARCHETGSWLVQNINELHEENGFPLLGAHAIVHCDQCHTSFDQLTFGPTGHECRNCHYDDYLATTRPNHEQANYSTDCSECHQITAFEWTSTGISHDFFPLTAGHDIQNCASCHVSDDFSGLSTDCFSCHQEDYQSAVNPNHQSNRFSVDCRECHTTESDWMPAEFRAHDDQFFPIYSGSHAGEWNQCNECHTTPNDYAVFDCLTCHEHNQTETDEKHAGIDGYSYVSSSCFACHPRGDEQGGFDHSLTAFALTGAHQQTDCIACHQNGYVGTSTTCSDCHQVDYNQTVNPDHEYIGLSGDCALCHSTEPGWSPAEFPVHEEYYVLRGAHATIANDCASCHNGNYLETANTCAACHREEYVATSNPPHQLSGFSEDCASCHQEDAWQPATFDHDNQYFPIASGPHTGTWSLCSDCHKSQSTYAEFTCTECHEHNMEVTQEQHVGIAGYVFESTACLTCHPTGTSDGAFDHNTTAFPLSGAHKGVDCRSCHVDSYAGTSSNCVDCHLTEYTQSINPNHLNLDLSNDCASCHTTEPGWSPALFDRHHEFFLLEGAHVAIANDCASCHQGNYVNTPNTCVGCHLAEYNATTTPPHQAEDYPTECIVCHSQSAWQPATFDHNITGFVLTGSHTSVDCNSCHSDGYTGTSTLCADCHLAEFNQSTNPNHGLLGLSVDCAGCHTTQPGWQPATFAVHNQYYQLDGAHALIANSCADCHNGNYVNTPNTCGACHIDTYNSTTNPAHQSSGFPTTCESCHSQSAWTPASFEHFFPIYSGKHEGEWQNCTDCHTAPNNYAVFSCVVCHEHNQSEMDDKHSDVNDYRYESNACLSCHPTGD